MAIPNGYRLLNESDIGKVFGVNLETTAYVYFENDYVELSSFWYSTKQLTDFMTYNYDDQLGGVYVSFASGIVSGADNLWQNTPTPFETCTIAEGTELTIFNTDADWNNWFYVKDKADPKTQFITDMNSLAESIVDKAGSSGKKTIKEMKSLVDGLKTEFVTQEKTVTPTKSSQAITPDSGKDGLSKVTVNAIPDEYIIPSGELEITENGTHDVTDKASVVVNVPSVTVEQWDGSYEEISSGFTLTLELGTNRDGDQFTTNYQKYYSIDGGVTKVQLYGLTPPVVLENVTEIIFYDESMGTGMGIGSTISGAEYGGVHSGSGIYELKISIDKDTTMYLSTSTTPSGGGSD